MKSGSSDSAADEAIRISYEPRPGLLRLVIINFLLSASTLTFYRFWAKTNVRRHIWSCVHIDGEPLEYTGKGIELFLGSLFVFAFMGLPAVLILGWANVELGPDDPRVATLQSLILLAAVLLWGAAFYRARRYRLAHTSWRGIRASLGGSALTYTLVYFAALVARVLTLGWSTPKMNCILQRRMTNAAAFGTISFSFDGPARPLYGSYALSWVLFAVTIPVLATILSPLFETNLWQIIVSLAQPQNESTGMGFIPAALVVPGIFAFAIYPVAWSVYTARELTLFASYTRFAGARFKLEVRPGSIMRLGLGNLLIWVLTLGIGVPFIQERLIKFLCAHLTVQGRIDFSAIRQSEARVPWKGEGLADMLNIGWL
jgi:uncharacterized membrane protein YjgN (DUF898 family)